MYVVKSLLLGSKARKVEGHLTDEATKRVMPIMIKSYKEENPRRTKRLVTKPMRYRTEFDDYLTGRKFVQQRNSNHMEKMRGQYKGYRSRFRYETPTTRQSSQYHTTSPAKVIKYKFGIGTLNTKVVQSSGRDSNSPSKSAEQKKAVASPSTVTAASSATGHLGHTRAVPDIFPRFESFNSQLYSPYGYYFGTSGSHTPSRTYIPQELLTISSTANSNTAAAVPYADFTPRGCIVCKLSILALVHYDCSLASLVVSGSTTSRYETNTSGGAIQFFPTWWCPGRIHEVIFRFFSAIFHFLNELYW